MKTNQVEKSRYKYQEEILKICKKKHLTAENILEKLQKKYPEAGQATVYRTIKFLSDKNLLNKISLNNKSYYETQENFHGHLIDKNKIKDFELTEEMIRGIEKKLGKKIKALDLKVFV